MRRWKEAKLRNGSDSVSVYYPVLTSGPKILRPRLKLQVKGTPLERIDFASLMIALFLGTDALPHILIRYYTVPSPAAARKSTIVAIAAIGAMTSGVINLQDNNMSTPLLARTFGSFLVSMISAIAFATVLGTVSGLIIAATGAVAHDLLDRFAGVIRNDRQKVVVEKNVAFVVGGIAIVLEILFRGVNVSFLVGLAFAVAASAILLIVFSPTMYELYGINAALVPVPLRNPGIISIPLSLLTLIIVSLVTGKKAAAATA